jgi:hypothetical protein
MSEDKIRTEDSCWSVGTIYDPRELPRVSIVDPGLDGVLQIEMATGPRFPAGKSSIRGWGCGRFSPRGDVNGEKSSPDG